MYTLELYKLALKVEGISEQYRKKLNSWMIEFYLEYYNAESFTDEYKQLDTYNLSVRDSACLVKILIDYGMYYEARQLIDKYGYADVDATKLFMFMVHELEASVNEEEYKNKISEYVFKKHLYNEQLLTYMVEHYNSTNTDMYVLWKTSKEFGVNVDSLSERIISQMMFTNVYSNRLAEVFADYYNNVAGYSIVKAYAAYNSYNYVIKNKKADPVIFKVIERAYKDKIGLPLLCYIAWLKEKSLELSLLNESDIKKTAQSILDELCEKELIYNFYKKFNGILSIPYNAYGLTVIEYFGIPDRKVELHYRINDDREYKTAVMKSDICGIFTYKLSELLGFKITVLCGICHFVFPPHPYKQKNPGTKQKLLSLCLVSGKILVSFRANIYFCVFYQRFCVLSRAKITEIYPFLKSRYFRNSFAAAARYLRSLKRNR